VTVNGGLAVLGAFHGSGSFTDADFAGDTFTATVSWSKGMAAVPLTLSGNTFVLSHNYGGLLGSHTVTVTITDEEGVSGTGSATVTVLL
jgi:hypothetical protein